MAEPDMVPDVSAIDGGVPTISAKPERHTERSHGSTAHTGVPQHTKLATWRVPGSNIK